VDDWALRKGQTYGTVLVDLEHHKPIDLLSDREASTLADWLRSHPEVELISRDRAGAYADGPHQGAPQAVQVADRWHLLKNMTEAVERFMDRHHRLVRQAAKDVAEVQLIDHWLGENSDAMLSSRDEAEKRARRQKRYVRYLEVMELHKQGVSERGITRALSINRATVRRFIHADGFPERTPKKSSGSILIPTSLTSIDASLKDAKMPCSCGVRSKRRVIAARRRWSADTSGACEPSWHD